MWLSAAEFLVPGYGCMSTHGMCLLVPFLPSCLLKIYLELKQAGHGGRSDYLPRELVTGPCSALFSTSSLHFQSWRAEKSAKISTFCWAEPHFPQACLLWTRAHKYSPAGLNPRLGNELQLQEKKSNYMKCVPLDEPSSRSSSLGLTSSLQQQHIYPRGRGVKGDESGRESASRGSAGAGRHL